MDKPATEIAKQLKELTQLKYFHGLITRDDVGELVKHKKEFLLRVSEPSVANQQVVVISIMTDPNAQESDRIKHYFITSKPKGYYCGQDYYKTIKELVETYMENQIALDVDKKVKMGKPINRTNWELLHERVTFDKKLGEGAYGEVWMGKFDGKTKVAVKKNHMEKLTKYQINEVMFEVRIMRRTCHFNIVKLIGVAALEQPLLIVMELADNGSLDSYLEKNADKLSPEQLSYMIIDIAYALRYLRKIEILHRDLAVRNCLLFGDVVKISDFGKAQRGPEYVMDPKEKLPIRWLSPETMRTKKFNYASEVWSFGIVCWEIFSKGAEPYPGMMVAEVNAKVCMGGYHLSMPGNTPKNISDIVEQNCFADEANRLTIYKVTELLMKRINREERIVEDEDEEVTESSRKSDSGKHDDTLKANVKDKKQSATSKNYSKSKSKTEKKKAKKSEASKKKPHRK